MKVKRESDKSKSGEKNGRVTESKMKMREMKVELDRQKENRMDLKVEKAIDRIIITSSSSSGKVRETC